jgi:hypothetical protein
MILSFVTRLASIVLLMAMPLAAQAETLNSTNYQIENPSIDIGGGTSSSTNYTSQDSVGDHNDSGSSSSNFKSLFGFLWHASPGVPGQPTLTNTGGNLYSSLDFVVNTGNNPDDATYAIAISSDDFATTNYIQTDDTVGSSQVWQTYANWGGVSGERVTGLLPNTTYKIKVKASFGSGSNAADSETAFSVTANAATANPSMTVSFSGINSGTSVAGETTNVNTGANSIPFGSLVVSTPKVAAHKTTVTTNASGGYTTTIQQDGNLRTTSGVEIGVVSGTNASPAAWNTGITAGEFGYHTTDSVLCTGSTNRFSSNNTFARLTTSAEEVACSSAAVTAEETTVVYKLEIGSLQPSGSFQNRLTFITTAKY